MKHLLLLSVLSLPAVLHAYEFQKPTRLTAAGKPIQVSSPGYAVPCFADVDKDGNKDLLVGQFAGGKIKFYRNTGDNNNIKLAEGVWLQAEGKEVSVPGIW